ncbi:hypothetical protein CLOM_g6714 [Closterium sp. NIES-68]|nr:hypothetical protein CLOM_g6714 [Closterium sp. NIES-68]
MLPTCNTRLRLAPVGADALCLKCRLRGINSSGYVSLKSKSPSPTLTSQACMLRGVAKQSLLCLVGNRRRRRLQVRKNDKEHRKLRLLKWRLLVRSTRISMAQLYSRSPVR